MNGASKLRRLRVVLWTTMCMALLGMPAAAQFGLRGGVNLTKFVGHDATNTESARGLNFGGTIPLIHIGPVSLVPEVYYSEKGAKQFDPLNAATFDYGLAYIEVPVLVKVSFPIKGWLRGYVDGGPTYAWNVDCSVTTDAAGAATIKNECGETFRSYSTAMEKADRGVAGGGGLDFAVPGFGGLNLDARVVRGLSRLREGTTGTDIKNQAFTLMLGWYVGR
jgi:hypothetical protein